MTLAMIIMIAVGLAAILVCLVLVALQGLRLYRAVAEMRRNLEAELRAIQAKQNAIQTHLEVIQSNQQVLSAQLQQLSQTMAKLSYLIDQYHEARRRLRLVS